MAALERTRAHLLLQATTEDERWLVADAGRAGHLLLDDACYPVSSDAIVLPTGTTETSARRLVGVFERAAREHACAKRRRRAFKVLP